MPSDPRQTVLLGIDDETLSAPAPANTAAPASPRAGAELRGKTVWVIDGMSLIFQVFHAIPEMTGPRGQPVNAVFGFTRDLFYLIEQKRPDYLFCAFDTPEATFRHELSDTYKANRGEMPDDLAPQFDVIRRVLEGFGIPLMEAPGYEADDVLAHVARETEIRGGECYLVTGDKDCRQLITDQVKVFNVRKNQVFDRAALMEEWGVRPEQVVDFQALVGDSVDNIPGVPLIGPKVARELLGQYGTLDEVLAHVKDIAGAKRRENLLAFGRRALDSRALVRLEPNVPLTIDWGRACCGPLDTERLDAIFQECGFRTFREKLATHKPTERVETPIQTACRVTDTRAALDELVARLANRRVVSLRLQTTCGRPREAKIVGISLATDGEPADYLPVAGPGGAKSLELPSVLHTLGPLLTRPDIKIIGHDLKRDLVTLRSAGARVEGTPFDTMVASYLLEAGQRNHSLDDLAQRLLNRGLPQMAEVVGTGKAEIPIEKAPIDAVAAYAAERTEAALRLAPILDAHLAASGATKLFTDVEMPLLGVLAEMEFHGVRIDVDRLAALGHEYRRRMDALEIEIYQIAGHEFNIASPKQLQQVLFVEQGLPIVKRTKTGPSTDAEVLAELAAGHPLPAKIIEHRQYAKLLGTYIDPLPTMVNAATGRVHATFDQAVAATGRLSSSDPNLQNIPIRTDAGREIRSAFVPGEPGWKLLFADYSQIELRVLAHFSRDPILCEAFDRDEDVHARVAAEVFNVPLPEVTSEQRRRAKAVNFGVIYGQSAFGLANTLSIEKVEAAQFIDAYFARYDGVNRFLNETLDFCAKNGYVRTILDRRRAISGVRPVEKSNPLLPNVASVRQKNLAERTAVNTVIQGSAADLIKLAMIAIHRRLVREKLRSRMLLQIHDELVFETPPDEVDSLGRLVTEEMTGVMKLSVPLAVDIQVGPNWNDGEAWKDDSTVRKSGCETAKPR
jgi:DNA polymerase-1